MLRGVFLISVMIAVAFQGACSDEPVIEKPDGRADGSMDMGPDSATDLSADLAAQEASAPDKSMVDAPSQDQLVKDQFVQLDKGTCSLTISSVNKIPVSSVTTLSSADDQDTAALGIQVNVEVTTINLADGTKATLSVTDQNPQTVTVTGGKALFSKVTVKKTLTLVQMVASSGTCLKDAVAFAVALEPSCKIASPATSGTLYPKDNTSTTSTKFTTNVVVTTNNAKGGTVNLTVNSSAAKPSSSAAASSQVTFKDTELKYTAGAKEQNEIEATILVPVGGNTLKSTCKSSVYVDSSTLTCKLDNTSFSPAPATIPTSPGYALSSYLNTVTVSTEALTDQVVLSLGSGTSPIFAVPSGGKAVFNAVLPLGTTTLQATCKSSKTGQSNTSAPFTVLVTAGAPNSVTDLACAVTSRRGGEITCSWKTNGTSVASYKLNLLPDTVISSTNFDDTSAYTFTGNAASHGQINTVTTKDLPLGHTYYAAVKQVDAFSKESAISNLPAGNKVDYLTFSIMGTTPNNSFGSGLASGDFNCDGYSDVAVGEQGFNGQTGRVSIYWGSATGLVAGSPTVINGTELKGKFGLSLKALQYDADTTGCTDLAVHAYAGMSNRGRVFLYLGRSSWFTRSDLNTGTGAEVVFSLANTTTTQDNRLAWGMAKTDLNGDGKGDLAMSHFSKNTGGFAEVTVHFGRSTYALMNGISTNPALVTIPTDADLLVQGGKSDDAFGQTLAEGGRVDKDIYNDLLIAAPYQSPPNYYGAVFVLRGAASGTGQTIVSITDKTRMVPIIGESGNAAFGTTIAGLGDMNGDGTGEFVVGEPYYSSTGNTYDGKIYVFTLGGTTNPAKPSDAIATVTNDNASPSNDLLGRGLANGAQIDASKGADMNNDGRAEMMFSSFYHTSSTAKYGQVYMYFGKSGTITSKTLGNANYIWSDSADASPSYGLITTFAKDINGDGYNDLVIGDPEYSASKIGRIQVYY